VINSHTFDRLKQPFTQLTRKHG